MIALEEIKKALEGDMDTGLTAIDRLRFIVGGVPDFDPITVEDADWIIAALESLQRENAELRAWQAGALSCREAEQARIDDYKRELEEALCAQDIATREQTAAFGIAQARAEVAEAEVMRLRALSVVGEPPFEFDRYISGALMAEGVRIEKIETLEKAMVVAAKVASRGPNGEVPVLIMRARTALASTGGEHHAE